MITAAKRSGATTAATAVARDDVRLGKDMLELVSTAMYVDPMNVYREYIQNAADGVDAAVKIALISERDGAVDISIDPETRTIRIRDNGIGVPLADISARLTALGGSAKRGTCARGFRGVGRLVGLGHSQELIFRSRALGDDRVGELRWDCRRLKSALGDRAFSGDVADLIANVVSVSQLDGSDYPSHFFEVELNRVVRQRNDRLMDPASVSDYLSQVAPVPFSPDFEFGSDILAALRAATAVAEIDIRINGAAPLRRPHRNAIDVAPGKVNPFAELSLLEFPGMEGDVAAVGWFLHHQYEGALPVATLIKGVRMRTGNLQIGDHTVLEEIFPESRFNAWTVGEIHILDPRIIPNGRRDQFEQNSHFNNLVNQLGPTARDIARRCRTSSAKRSRLREFESGVRDIEVRLDILRQGTLCEQERQSQALAVEAALSRLDRLGGEDRLLGEETPRIIAKLIELRATLGQTLDEAGEAIGPLDRLPADERATYEQMFTLIYECSANRASAKSLVDRIVQKIAS